MTLTIKLLKGITVQPKNFIIFSIASTLATIMTWWLSLIVIDAYSKVPNSKEIVFGIAIAFTILYYTIAFFKMIDLTDVEYFSKTKEE